MRHGSLLLLLLLLACTADPPSVAPAYDLDELTTKAPEIGGLVRAAQLCGLALSQPAQERAARIEEAALEVQRHRGGTQARDALLHDMAPPQLDPAQRVHDRAGWCMERRPAVQQMDGMLNSAEGTALVQRAEAAQASLR
ncbi:hypothetical protein ACFQS7_10415 [Dankookia sp. GCM10030260]|uniref:hypothetical protein n=1 Tax=Dankookia sp. GCM10030260 TaxID=3273390 RepID=UPI003608017F